jgi:hypothetical protein
MRASFLLILSLSPALSFTPQRFTFPGVPFDVGVRHIHSPEHFVAAHGLSPPGFEIVETSAPLWIRDHVLMGFRYRTWFGEGEGRLFTDDWTKSMVWLASNGQKCGLTSSLRVWREGTQGYGVAVEASEYGDRPLLERWAWKQATETDVVLNAASTGYGTMREDPNLRDYRRLVLWGLKRGVRNGVLEGGREE